MTKPESEPHVSSPDAIPSGSRASWRLFFGASLALSLVLALLGIRSALDGAGIRARAVPLDVAHNLHERLEALPVAEVRGPDRRDAVFFGDSTVGSHGKANSIAALVEQFANEQMRGQPTLRVHDLAAPGLGPFDFYFMAGRVAERGPDLAIVLVNLTTFSESWTQTFRRPELASLIPVARLPEALALPLYRVGATTDNLLLSSLLAKLGALDAWRALRREQTRFNRGRDVLSNRVDDALAGGLEQRFILDRIRHFDALYNLSDRGRLSVTGMQNRYGSALDGIDADHPNLAMIAATLRILREGGVPTLVYVNPTNVEHARSLGGWDEARLAITLEQVAAVAASNAAGFLDLHAIFPDSYFRDAAGHFSTGEPDAMAELARALTPAVVEQVRSRHRNRGARN